MTPLQKGQLLASKNAVTDIEIDFEEAPLVHVRTRRVSAYAARYVNAIKLANNWMTDGSWYPWTAEWWRQSGKDSMAGLQAMLAALDESGAKLVNAFQKEVE